MTDQSMLDNSTVSSAVLPTNPHEIAVQLLWKQLLKYRLFKGFYVERRYVENINGYRDIVCLLKSEKSLDKILRDIRDKLQLLYGHQNPLLWIGITSGTLNGNSTPQPAVLETCLWVELKDLAFGQYWFSINSIRVRDNEIILMLKKVQPIEEDETPKWTPNTPSITKISDKTDNSLPLSTDSPLSAPRTPFEYQVKFNDFMLLLQQWWVSTKQTVYDFMANDISKENIQSFLKFLGMLIVAMFAFSLECVKYLGSFTLRFMFELSRLIRILTPIIIKILEMLNKIICGFFMLLAMIWKDVVVNRNQPKHVVYRPMHNSMQYVRIRRPIAYH